MTPTETLARTAYGEASSDGADGMAAVMNVVVNRVNSGKTWWGHDIASVCLAHQQFDCWFADTADYVRMMAADMGDPMFALAMDIAAQAVDGTLPDITNGATSYKTTELPWPHAWGPERDPLCVIGSQAFYDLSAPPKGPTDG